MPNFDLDNLDPALVQEVVEVNPTADPTAAPPPPSDGRHRMKITIDSYEGKESQKDGRPYFLFKAHGTVVDEGPDFNKRVFLNLTTFVFDGRNEMAYMITQALGGNNNPEAVNYVAKLNNYALLARGFRDVFAAEPILVADTQWVAEKPPAEPGGKYTRVRTGQKNFPKNADGSVSPLVIVDGQELSAKAVVRGWFPDGTSR